MVINQPSGSIKLTNVAHVRMKKGRKRFEIVCYQNKVQDYRRGVEKDLDEVLQVPHVFVNASKGEVASSDELANSFGTASRTQVVNEILEKGELQVGDKERRQDQEQLHASILEIIFSKCVNPNTNKPYPVSILRKALTELGFQYTSKPAKGQALEAMKLLLEKQLIPIARARMRVRVSDDAAAAAKYTKEVMEIVQLDSERWEPFWEAIGTIDPGEFRRLDDLVRAASNGGGVVDVVAVDY